MKHIDYFAAFLRDTVNLNQTRLDLLDDRVDVILAALKADEELGPLVLDHIPQGSWAHRTIIKPLPDKEFDADFLLLLEEQPGWSPAAYIDEVDQAFGRNTTYAKMRKRKNRCVRIVYANDCHVDVVPFIKLAGSREVIVNYEEDDWEDTNPQGFTSWMKSKDEVTSGHLRRVIRLLKYLRDYKGTFSIKSVIMTTLVGGVVEEWRKLEDPAHYSDVPTSLRSVVNDLDAWLQERPMLPLIEDPSCPGTDFNHRWNQAGYSNFRDKIHTYYAPKINAAYLERDPEKSLKLWREVFGDEFRKPVTTSGGGRFGSVIAPAAQSGRGG
jgi:hypothetical protein